MTRFVKTVGAGLLMMKEVESLEKALVNPDEALCGDHGRRKGFG